MVRRCTRAVATRKRSRWRRSIPARQSPVQSPSPFQNNVFRQREDPTREPRPEHLVEPDSDFGLERHIAPALGVVPDPRDCGRAHEEGFAGLGVRPRLDSGVGTGLPKLEEQPAIEKPTRHVTGRPRGMASVRMRGLLHGSAVTATEGRAGYSGRRERSGARTRGSPRSRRRRVHGP